MAKAIANNKGALFKNKTLKYNKNYFISKKREHWRIKFFFQKKSFSDVLFSYMYHARGLINSF